MYVCLCKGLTESDIQRVARSGHSSPAALIKVLGLEDEDCCGRCLESVDTLAEMASPACAQCPFSHPLADRLDTQSGTLR